MPATPRYENGVRERYGFLDGHSSLRVSIFYSDSVWSLHPDDRHGEATVHYQNKIFNLAGEASM